MNAGTDLQAVTHHQTPRHAPALEPLRRVDALISKLEQGLLMVLMGAMILLGVAQIVMRQAFHAGFPWADPVLRNMVLWAGMLGASVATEAGRHLNMDALVRLLPKALHRWVDVLINALSAGLCAWLLKVSIAYVKDEMANAGEPIVGGFQHWHAELVFPLMLAIMAFRFALAALDGLLGPGGDASEDEGLPK